MSLIAVALNLLLAVLLVVALGFGWRLERRLKALRDSHAGFAKAVADLDQAAARAVSSARLSATSAFWRASGEGAGTSSPASAASCFTASMKGRPILSVMKRITSPCAPQPKQ